MIKYEFAYIILIFTCRIFCLETQNSNLWDGMIFQSHTFKGVVILWVLVNRPWAENYLDMRETEDNNDLVKRT